MQSAFVKGFFLYSLAIGVTANRMVNRRFFTSKFTRAYVLAYNVITLVGFPILLWMTEGNFQKKMNYPILILVTYRLRFILAYVIIAYTILSRGFRDLALFEMEPVLSKLYGEEKNGGIHPISGSLRLLFYLKFATVIWRCTTDSIFLFYSTDGYTLATIVRFIFLSNSYNMLNVVSMSYFLSMWHIAHGYECVNVRLEKLSQSRPSRSDLKELQNLWSLHAALTKTVLRINRIFSPQMLAARADCFVFGVVQGYWGAFFTFDLDTSMFWIVYGSIGYFMSSLDYYLIDHMCDLVGKYQNARRDDWSESRWTEESSAFVTYANSSKLELWICGLYKVNKSLWFDMISGVLYYFIMLLQFHLVLQKV
ncbi:hypothetical protein KR074_005048 [Drosophila pseudoananassae]|nr:hypothetical protein KR074_005048 [Drosophila pseudoananassae]